MKLFSTIASFIVFIVYASMTVGWRPHAEDITGTISKVQPTSKQDGSAARPYAEASQCPPNIDLIFWSNGQSIPSFPPGISVCFVGDQVPNDNGSVRVQIRD